MQEVLDLTLKSQLNQKIREQNLPTTIFCFFVQRMLSNAQRRRKRVYVEDTFSQVAHMSEPPLIITIFTRGRPTLPSVKIQLFSQASFSHATCVNLFTLVAHLRHLHFAFFTAVYRLPICKIKIMSSTKVFFCCSVHCTIFCSGCESRTK